VSLNVEGLYLADAIRPKVSLSTQNQIKAIMSVAAQKNHQKVEGGEIRRRIEVTERAMMRARDAGSKRRSLAAILEQVVERAISDQPISDAKDAYRHFEGRGHFGKVVITQA
jgi:hypothetical protein